VPVIGITGGIATGKSLFLKALLKAAPSAHFDADTYVHMLLATDERVCAEISAAFGPAVLHRDGGVDRSRLRGLVFSDAGARRQLERIIHPRVREAWLSQAETCRADDAVFYADIPLLYETASESYFDRVVVVACSPQSQRERMRTQRELAPELIERMITAQLDLAVKVARADHLIWNDSTATAVDDQACCFAGWLRQRYG